VAIALDTGYRYYALDQLPRLNRILALKDLGFPLSEIARLLDADFSPEHLRGMFGAQQAHVQQTIAAEQARLARIAARLRQIEQEDTTPRYDVLLKRKRQDSERKRAAVRVSLRCPWPDRAYAAGNSAHTAPHRSWNRRRRSARDTVSFKCWRKWRWSRNSSWAGQKRAAASKEPKPRMG